MATRVLALSDSEIGLIDRALAMYQSETSSLEIEGELSHLRESIKSQLDLFMSQEQARIKWLNTQDTNPWRKVIICPGGNPLEVLSLMRDFMTEMEMRESYQLTISTGHDIHTVDWR